jgi:rod shape-determining protein MreC
MESFFVRFKNPLVLIAVLLAQTILLAVQVRRPEVPGQADGPRVLLLRSWVVAAVTPVERLSSATGALIRGGWSDYLDLRHTRRQNQELREEIARMRLEEAEFAEDAMQGRRLQALLKFREQYVTETVAAQVVGTSGVEQSRVLYIDKGAADGIKADMAVITPDGIVGKVREVYPGLSPHTAQVLEIDDPSAGAGVILASTRIRAILRGGPDGRVQITNLTQDSRIKPGEAVLTSGGDQVFPRGLKVGTIESIAPDPDHQPYTRIVVKSSANLSQLEEVLVITGTQPELTPKGQQDLAAGEATAIIEAKRAADLAAERLPSLSSGDAQAAAGGANGAAGATPGAPGITTMPKPIPTLHPDGFTPGVTPPAAELTPGGRNPAPTAAAARTEEEGSPQDSGGAEGTAPAGKPKLEGKPPVAKPASPQSGTPKPASPKPQEPQPTPQETAPQGREAQL